MTSVPVAVDRLEDVAAVELAHDVALLEHPRQRARARRE